MADREKVIKGLECCAIGLYCPDEDCPYEEAREEKDENCIAMLARDALELLKEKEPGWISVKDQMPDKLDQYLVVNDGKIGVAIYHDGLWIMPTRFQNITHWMPLPEPPKEVSE